MEKINFENFNYDSIKYFISVAEHGSLLKASYSLGISQSALSQSMKNLEESLGVKLFNRNTRGIILTSEGENFYESAKIGNDFFENAIVQTIRTTKFDSLKTFKISISGSLEENILAPCMRDIIAKYPQINFEITSLSTEFNVVEKLQKNEVDLAFIKADEQFNAKEIVVQKLVEFNYYLTYNPVYFDFKDNITYEDIKDYPIILKRRTGKTDNSWLKSSFEHIVTCQSDRSILDFIKSGTGLGICAKEIAERQGLKTINLADFPKTTRVITACYLNQSPIAKEITSIILASLTYK